MVKYNHTAELLGRLNGVTASSNGWEARCPCRQDDQNPSLSIHEKDDGQILVHCHRSAGACGAAEIVAAVGLTLSDLRPDKKMDKTDFDPPTYKKAKSQKLKFVSKYQYLDSDGTLLFEKVRFLDADGKKTFRQRRPDGSDGWTYKLGSTPKVLYNLPKVLRQKEDGQSIFVVEGEKDCDTLIELGACATTMPGGAGKWLDLHTEALAGATVDIIADNDEPGRKHALHVYKELKKAGCDVEIFQCPESKDITDHIEAGGSTTELIKIDLEILKSEFAGKPTQEELQENEEDDLPPPTPEELAVEEIRQLLDDPNKTPLQILNRAQLLTQVQDNLVLRDEGRLVVWDKFLAEAVSDEYDWLIPGLLERKERVIVVAAEGVGKTMLARQVAICAGLGVNPFTFQQMPPIRTLTVDLENPERIIRRTSRSIVGAAKSMGFERHMTAHLFIKSDGLDLLNAYDRLLLEQHIEEVQPELLVMGPLYKAFLDPGNRTSEAVAIEVARYLDTLRVVYGVALWLEHHAPLGTSMTSRELRPFGSAVWSRWPEFGLALQPDPTHMGEYVYEVNHFRGARDQRYWPLRMKRGTKFPFEVIEFMDVS
jgi:5S rRNA maturation endonuclease (ribonuclease M5)